MEVLGRLRPHFLVFFCSFVDCFTVFDNLLGARIGLRGAARIVQLRIQMLILSQRLAKASLS